MKYEEEAMQKRNETLSSHPRSDEFTKYLNFEAMSEKKVLRLFHHHLCLYIKLNSLKSVRIYEILFQNKF